MEVSRIVTLVLAFVLAFIPAGIADRKGYNKVGFYFYGLFMFLPALIHALVIPDHIDQSKKPYRGNTLKYNILAVVFLWLNFLFTMTSNFTSFYAFPMETLLSLVFGFALVISAIVGRRYIFSILVYAYNVIAMGYKLWLDFQSIDGGEFAFYNTKVTYPSMISNGFMALVYIVLIIIAVKFGVNKNVSKENDNKIIFVLPALLAAISCVGIVMIFINGYYTSIVYVVFSVIAMAGFVLGVLFLGLFYREDSRESEASVGTEAMSPLIN